MAGVLGVRLRGHNIYFGHRVDKSFIGEARQPLDQERQRRAIRLLYGTTLAMAAITLVDLLAGCAGAWGLLSLVS